MKICLIQFFKYCSHYNMEFVALSPQGVSTSPWANILAMGLKILSAILGGGGAGGDGIDKVDNSSPLQVGNRHAFSIISLRVLD